MILSAIHHRQNTLEPLHTIASTLHTHNPITASNTEEIQNKSFKKFINEQLLQK
jgi:hypothetical protein